MPSKAFRAYQKMALKQLVGYPTIMAPVSMQAEYWLKDNRKPDLINLIQATADILEEAKVIDNDRQIISLDGSRIAGVDRDNPRVEITLRIINIY